MKKMHFSLLVGLSILISVAFMTDGITPEELNGTKWISPVRDSCYTSLCFNSDRTVFFQECGDDWSFEIGYTISDDIIKVNVMDSLGNPMTFRMEDGILRQASKANNRHPKNFILVPGGKCE